MPWPISCAQVISIDVVNIRSGRLPKVRYSLQKSSIAFGNHPEETASQVQNSGCGRHWYRKYEGRSWGGFHRDCAKVTRNARLHSARPRVLFTLYSKDPLNYFSKNQQVVAQRVIVGRRSRNLSSTQVISTVDRVFHLWTAFLLVSCACEGSVALAPFRPPVRYIQDPPSGAGPSHNAGYGVTSVAEG